MVNFPDEEFRDIARVFQNAGEQIDSRVFSKARNTIANLVSHSICNKQTHISRKLRNELICKFGNSSVIRHAKYG